MEGANKETLSPLDCWFCPNTLAPLAVDVVLPKKFGALNGPLAVWLDVTLESDGTVADGGGAVRPNKDSLGLKVEELGGGTVVEDCPKRVEPPIAGLD